jgi:hypothetical protein
MMTAEPTSVTVIACRLAPPVSAWMNDSQDILKQASAIAGLDATGARLLRVGSNTVYRLKDPIIARVSRPARPPCAPQK